MGVERSSHDESLPVERGGQESRERLGKYLGRGIFMAWAFVLGGGVLGRIPGKYDDYTDPLDATEGRALIASVLLLIAAAVSLTYAYLPIRKTGKHWFLYGLAASLTILAAAVSITFAGVSTPG